MHYYERTNDRIECCGVGEKKYAVEILCRPRIGRHISHICLAKQPSWTQNQDNDISKAITLLKYRLTVFATPVRTNIVVRILQITFTLVDNDMTFLLSYNALRV